MPLGQGDPERDAVEDLLLRGRAREHHHRPADALHPRAWASRRNSSSEVAKRVAAGVVEPVQQRPADVADEQLGRVCGKRLVEQIVRRLQAKPVDGAFPASPPEVRLAPERLSESREW